MMKFNSTVLAITLFAFSASAVGMQQNPPVEAIAQNHAAQQRSRGWFESWLPNTYDNADQLTEAIKKVSKDGVTLNHEMKVKHEMFGDPNTIVEFNKTGVNLMKTYLTAGIGGALALTGVILFFKTLMNDQQQEAQKQDLRPLYKKIITNRYLISAILIAAGTGIVLKSDKIVAAVA